MHTQTMSSEIWTCNGSVKHKRYYLKWDRKRQTIKQSQGYKQAPPSLFLAITECCHKSVVSAALVIISTLIVDDLDDLRDERFCVEDTLVPDGEPTGLPDDSD